MYVCYLFLNHQAAAWPLISFTNRGDLVTQFVVFLEVIEAWVQSSATLSIFILLEYLEQVRTCLSAFRHVVNWSYESKIKLYLRIRQ